MTKFHAIRRRLGRHLGARKLKYATGRDIPDAWRGLLSLNSTSVMVALKGSCNVSNVLLGVSSTFSSRPVAPLQSCFE